MELTLEDGSRLWLNSGTDLEYPAVFSRKSRDVVLHSGEVMFDVANDVRRPFNVETYASTISVLGTKFNVSVDEASGEFSAALLRGSIRVDNNLNENEAFVLRPNQMVRMKDNHLLMEHFWEFPKVNGITGVQTVVLYVKDSAGNEVEKTVTVNTWDGTWRELHLQGIVFSVK